MDQFSIGEQNERWVRFKSALTVIVEFVDLNADGQVDHIIPGSKFIPEVVVFAPGAQANKGRPQGVKVLTPELIGTVAQLRNWMSDGTYFNRVAEPIDRTQEGCYRGPDGIPVCNWPGFWRNYPHQRPPGGPASPDWQNPPGRDKPQGHNPEPQNRPWTSQQVTAIVIAGYIETTLTADTASLADLRKLSDLFKHEFGVPMFGFDSSGAWSEPKYRDDFPHPCSKTSIPLPPPVGFGTGGEILFQRRFRAAYA